MLTFSRSAWPRRTAALLALLTLTTACSSDEPTAAEAGQTLKTHILELMKEGNVLDVLITDPGGRDISCGDGKAKRTFAATGRDTAAERSPNILRSILLGALQRVAPYEIVSPSSMNDPIHVTDKAAGTMLVLDSPGNGRYEVSGETQCLPKS